VQEVSLREWIRNQQIAIKIFPTYIFDKGCVFEIQKEHLQLNSKKIIQLKMTEDLNRHFTKEDKQISTQRNHCTPANPATLIVWYS
jgi:hypothetical protein